MTILGATSGDTGSAAIHGLRGKKGLSCFILYPLDRVSPIQERQMTTVPDKNIHCLRVKGTFDDCQDMVKAGFMDEPFREAMHLGAVNSINFARVLAQITYYFYGYFQVVRETGESSPVNFSVPTGNFGDVLACHYAKQMGLDVGKLVVGTNENDILARFFASGLYERKAPMCSISPSMDICVSSNFERYLFHSMQQDAASVRQLMSHFEGPLGIPPPHLEHISMSQCVLIGEVKNGQGTASEGKLRVSDAVLSRMRADGFVARSATTEEALSTIRNTFQDDRYLMCPHTACGVVAASKLNLLTPRTVCLVTAHPAKFYESVGRAVSDLPPLPQELEELKVLPVRLSDIPNDLAVCQRLMKERVLGSDRHWSVLSVGFPLVAALTAGWVITQWKYQ